MTQIKQGKGETTTKTKGVMEEIVEETVDDTASAFGEATKSEEDQEVVDLRAALTLGGLKNHDTIIPNLNEQQKKDLIAASRQYKETEKNILTNQHDVDYLRLKKIRDEYLRLDLARWAQSGDEKEQASKFHAFVKEYFTSDFDPDSKIDADTSTTPSRVILGDSPASVAPRHLWDATRGGRAVAESYLMNRILLKGPKYEAGGWTSDPNYKYSDDQVPLPNGGYKELLYHIGQALYDEEFTNFDENIKGKFYLKLLDRELRTGRADGKSVILNFISWTDQEEAKQRKIRSKIQGIAGVAPSAQTAVTEDVAPVESDEMLSDEIVERQRRFQDQCFLTVNFDRIMKETAIRGASYKNFVSVQGEPFIATNNLTFHKGQKAFIDLTSTEMSTLLPKVQLSKVIYGPGGGANELISIPFIFGTHNDFKDPSMLTMGKRARGDDAGIESFTFAFEGQDYATADKILVCNATYFFKSMSDFIAEFSVRKGKNTFEFSYTDLAAYPAGRRPFTIRADVGWQTPSNLASIVGETRANKIRKAAASAKLSMFMNVVNFNYEVNEDGSIKVFVEYRGWINDLLSNLKFDIFLKPETSQGVEEHKIKTAEYLLQTLSTAEMLNRQAKHVGGLVRDGTDMDLQVSLNDNLLHFASYLSQTLEDTPGTNTANTDVDSLSKLLEPDTGTARSLADVLFGFQKDRKGADGDKDYRQALVESSNRVVQRVKQAGQLISHDGLLEEVFKEGLVYVVNVPKSSLAHYQKSAVNKNLSPSLAKTPDIKKKKNDSFSVTQLGIGPQAVVGDDLISATNRAFRNRAKKNKQDSSHFPEAGGANGRFKDGYSIYFVTFGTILNAVLSRVYSKRSTSKNSFIEKFKVLVGSASTERGSFTADDISIADIPISLDLFTYWYLTEIMERDQVTYAVGPFIQNMLSKLILPSLGADCQGDSEVSDLYTVKGQIYNTSGKVKRKVKGSRVDLKKGDRVDSTEISVLRGSNGSSLKNTNSYYYIFMDTKTALKGTAKFEQQRKAGRILTLGTGYNRGLTRSIKFKGNDIPYFQEAADATFKEKAKGNNVRRMLKFHDADVELFVNTIFYPGMVVYIKPNFPGIRTPFGSAKQSIVTPNKIASTLGVGGFYVITKVRSNIDSSGGFTTAIVANYEAGVQKDG